MGDKDYKGSGRQRKKEEKKRIKGKGEEKCKEKKRRTKTINRWGKIKKGQI